MSCRDAVFFLSLVTIFVSRYVYTLLSLGETEKPYYLLGD